ncbi:unnamed protein product [Spirodela intermedia]|uniref:Uncharacterized protein n=1 Tax=Spirodela intermedia TaxID=51605 RepID=A0A7I8IF14_SPIIN|nr:unnamed protein product [Spirodela intermedia]CAA6656390.1 unnamed protein product [Spirodela intermedia]
MSNEMKKYEVISDYVNPKSTPCGLKGGGFFTLWTEGEVSSQKSSLL